MAECLEQSEIGVEQRTVPDAVFVRRDQTRMIMQPNRARIARLTLQEKGRIVKILAGSTASEEFIQLRKKLFQDYLNLSLILSNSFPISDATLRRIAIREAFQEVGHIIEGLPQSKLSADHKEEADFCIETLRRSYRLVEKIHFAGAVPSQKKEEDHRLAWEFSVSAIFSQLHIECLLCIIKNAKPLDSDILGPVLHGMRSSLMAYAAARQGLGLRAKSEEDFPAEMSLNREDNELLDESYHDSESSLRVK